MKRILNSLIESDGLANVLSSLRVIARERGIMSTFAEQRRYWSAMEASLAQLQINEAHHKTENENNTTKTT